MKKKLKKIFENAVWWSGVVMVGLVLGLTVQFVRAWTEPSVAPPGGNLGAPINTGIIAQAKQGVLQVLGLTVYNNPAVSGVDVTGKVLTAQNANGAVAWAEAGEITCPSGFTNVKSAGRQLGCMETSEEGEDPFFRAAKKCFDKYGGRLPSHTEWYVSMASYSLSEGSGRNWIDGDLNWWQYEIYGGQVIASSTAPYQRWTIGRNGEAYGYRCWIPR
jgi:hypothetical protein